MLCACLLLFSSGYVALGVLSHTKYSHAWKCYNSIKDHILKKQDRDESYWSGSTHFSKVSDFRGNRKWPPQFSLAQSTVGVREISFFCPSIRDFLQLPLTQSRIDRTAKKCTAVSRKLTSGTGPRQKVMSGVKLSGPFTIWRISALFRAGIRWSSSTNNSSAKETFCSFFCGLSVEQL